LLGSEITGTEAAAGLPLGVLGMMAILPRRNARDWSYGSKPFGGLFPVVGNVKLPREFFGVGGRGLAGVVDADVGCGFAFAGGALGEKWDQAACLIVIGAAARNDLVGEIVGVDCI
jgi:hypothetical protein